VSILTPEWTAVLYLVAAVCFILALKGLSSPGTARRGNLIGAGGAVLAVVTAFLSEEMDHVVPIRGAIAIGGAVGVPAARRVAELMARERGWDEARVEAETVRYTEFAGG
jgi:NAD(P) transhydrogenase subunit beta